MASNDFLTASQEQQLIDAIQQVEQQTSGEVRVHIEKTCEDEPLERASFIFHELGMDQTQLQNGVLIYVATKAHKAAVYAGKGIHRQVADNFWDDVLQILIDHFKKQEFEQGLEEAVWKVGAELAELFPYQEGQSNELSNDISYEES